MKKFTTPCFIRKNTPELRARLKGIGRRENECAPIGGRNILYVDNNGTYYDVADGCILPNSIAIDCGENESLFLALAAMNSTDDYMQCFTDGYHFEICPDKKANIAAWEMRYRTTPRKATVEEIINKFKN